MSIEIKSECPIRAVCHRASVLRRFPSTLVGHYRSAVLQVCPGSALRLRWRCYSWRGSRGRSLRLYFAEASDTPGIPIKDPLKFSTVKSPRRQRAGIYPAVTLHIWRANIRDAMSPAHAMQSLADGLSMQGPVTTPLAAGRPFRPTIRAAGSGRRRNKPSTVCIG